MTPWRSPLRSSFRVVRWAFACASALGSFAASDASAYVVKQTTNGDFVHWEEATVNYSFDPSLGEVTGAVAATSSAMESWSGSVGAPELNGHAASAVTDAPTAPGFDRKNGVFFMGNGYVPAQKALAITVLTYDNVSGRILDADIIVNGIYKFAVLPAPESLIVEPSPGGGTHPSSTDGMTHREEAQSYDDVYDLHHVVAHELGHTLGMNDEMLRSDSLMYRYSSPNDPSVRAPVSDDIAGLAELYSTKLEARGNGCGNATIAPKKPSRNAARTAMFATLGLVFFLLVRGRRDARAKFAFVAAAAISTYALLPDLTRASVAQASETAPGHARARVVATEASVDSGIFRTTFKLATTLCRASACPKTGEGSTWGGTIGNIRQEVGGHFAPSTGDDVDVSFTELPNAIAPLMRPLSAPALGAAAVRVITPAK